MDREEASALLLRHWDPLQIRDSDGRSTEYSPVADALIALMHQHGAHASRVSEYVSRTGMGARDADRDWQAGVVLATWYEHRTSTGPWSVQVEFTIFEPLHHSLCEEAAPPTFPQVRLAQSVGLVVANVEIRASSALDAASEGLRLAQARLPGPHLLYRVTVWRPIV